MFDFEAGSLRLSDDSIPQAVRQVLQETRSRIAAFSLTPWEEHCTECAIPDCYRTCDLYEPRIDGKCRRFVGGIGSVCVLGHPQGYMARISFKRWAKLMAYANGRLIPTVEAERIEHLTYRVAHVIARLPGASIKVAGRNGIPSRMVRRWKQYVSLNSCTPVQAAQPDFFLAEVFNPNTQPVKLSLTMINPDRKNAVPFEELLLVQPGMNRFEIDFLRIIQRVDIQEPMHVTLNPNILEAKDEGLTLFFGLLAFVKTVEAPKTVVAELQATKVRHIKVAVWDLDNTVWKGTLIEDGIDQVILREDVVRVICELDSRGIVNSVLSKNHEEDALAALRKFGIDKYFVFPKIGWGEKGAYMKSLVKDFNVDANTFAFIDDQQFERDQVMATNAGVRVYDSGNVMVLLTLPEFNPPLSDESAHRRSFYRAEENRLRDVEGFGGEYLEFLHSCQIRAEISRPNESNFTRIQELVQRTNQLNYSGTHYDRKQIKALLECEQYESFVISCTDRYGDYGTVGFALVDRSEVCLRDAMFSCRIQFKRVEHAFLVFLMHRYKAMGANYFRARFIETKKNVLARSVFKDMLFQEQERNGATRLYRFDLRKPIPQEGIVEISFEGVPCKP